MIPTNRFFHRNTETIYEGKLYSRIHRIINTEGKYRLHFKFISTNSEYKQHIGLSLYRFKGTVKINGEKVRLGKGEFTGLKFSEDTAPKRFYVDVTVESGDVNVFNGADGWRADVENFTPSAVPAMIVEKDGNSSYTFYCNDYVYDDDFDDLVFELRIESLPDAAHAE